MPTSKSAMKRLITDSKKQLRNRARKSTLKTLEKKFRKAVESADKEQAADTLKNCFSKLDKAAKVGTIHKNKANNKKAQLNKLFNTLQG
jgi:small subunit ribosomal protein S20